MSFDDGCIRRLARTREMARFHCTLGRSRVSTSDTQGGSPVHEQRPPESVRCIAGLTTLRELCGALKACHLFITNDTGPMHVAAAVGTPVIVPYGSTSPQLTGPGMPGDPRHRLIQSQVPCSPCFLRECPIDFRCMNSISVDAVVEAAMQTVWALTLGL